MTNVKRLYIPLTLGLGLTLAVLGLLSGRPSPATAAPAADIRYVATTGVDLGNECSTPGAPCRTMQHAVDVASAGDTIKVAAGLYTDTHVRPRSDVTTTGVVTQVVYVSKTVILQGGYTTTNWTTPDCEANHTTVDAQGRGRGLYISGDVSPTVEGLQITGGDAGGLGGSSWGDSGGGGVYVHRAAVTVSNCTIYSNTATAAEWDDGGGLYLHESDDATLSGNTISHNAAGDCGGGLYLYDSDDVTLTGNVIWGNTAGDDGSGLYLALGDVTLTNNVIADNQADNDGSALHVNDSSPLLLHTTMARNMGTGVHVADGAVTMSNTILVSHTVGIHVAAGETATLEATLWGDGAWANATDWSGAGTLVTETVNVWSDPAFVDPDAGDYHIAPDSAALDAGVDAGITVDMDGEPRPAGSGYDIGADEFPAALTVTKNAHPDPVQAGQPLTYTIWVTNTGSVDLDAAITDTLPTQVTPSEALTWTRTILAPDGVWSETVVVTAQWSYAGPLTNTVQVTTDEGASGATTETSQAEVTPALTLTKEATPDPVQAGQPLTYTIRVTNTGNVDLHATMTDTLPAQVSPSDPVTWTETITAPDGVWSETVVVTAQWSYAGPLTNTVQVTTDEGASGVITETSQAAVTPALTVTKHAYPNPVQAGQPLTYTIRVTNTGNVDLHATITDTLPAQVSPSDPVTWTKTIIAPGGVWSDTVVVTAQWSYAGPLTNMVEVTTDEGASGATTETSQAAVTPALTVTKEAHPDPVQAGEQLTYTIRVTNTGNVDLHATITDTLPAQVSPSDVRTWQATIEAPGDVWTKTLVVTAEMGRAGPLTNTVTVTTDEGASGTYTETSQAAVTPALAVTKHAHPDPVQAGEALTYTIRVANTGNADLHATVTDTLPAHVTPTGVLTWTPTIDAPDGVWTKTVVVTAEMGYAGPLTNDVKVTTDEGASGSDTTVTHAAVTPALTVTKEATPDPVQATEPLTYTIRVTNTGNVDLHAYVFDTLPEHVAEPGILQWTPIIPAPNGVWTETVVVKPAVGYAGPLTNTVVVATDEGPSVKDTIVTQSEVTPGLAVSKEAAPDPVQAGDQLTYTIRVTNTGNVHLHAIIIDTPPEHVVPSDRYVWTPTIFAPDGVWTETVVVTVEMGYAGPLTNTVRVTTDEGPSGRHTTVTQAEVTPRLKVTKQATPDPVEAGDQLTYTIQVTNTGNVDLHATITDTLPAHVTPTAVLTWTPTIPAPDGVWTETVVVTTEMGYARPLTNRVQVTTDEGASGGDTIVTQAKVTPGLTVSKQATPDPVQAGERLTYTLWVTNTGNANLHATVTDTLPVHVIPSGVVTWTPTIPAPDGVWSKTVVVTAGWSYAGPLTNTVRVTTDEGASGGDTIVTQAEVTPGLTVTKQATPDPVQAGEPLTYTIRVTNTGNVDLDATITDTLPAHVSPSGTHIWTPTISAPDGVWMETVVVTAEMGYAGALTNRVQVTTDQGASGATTETSQAAVTPALTVTKQAHASLVLAGDPLTYTIRVANIGNIELHATITDTLPTQVAPSDVLTWTATLSAPDGVWMETVVVTTDMDYVGPLTNTVEVTSDEGASASTTTVSQAATRYSYVYLPVLLREE